MVDMKKEKISLGAVEGELNLLIPVLNFPQKWVPEVFQEESSPPR